MRKWWLSITMLIYWKVTWIIAWGGANLEASTRAECASRISWMHQNQHFGPLSLFRTFSLFKRLRNTTLHAFLDFLGHVHRKAVVCCVLFLRQGVTDTCQVSRQFLKTPIHTFGQQLVYVHLANCTKESTGVIFFAMSPRHQQNSCLARVTIWKFVWPNFSGCWYRVLCHTCVYRYSQTYCLCWRYVSIYTYEISYAHIHQNFHNQLTLQFVGPLASTCLRSLHRALPQLGI